MLKAYLSRREIMTVAMTQAVLSLAVPTRIRAQDDPPGPVRRVVPPTEEPGCTVSQALSALAREDGTFQDTINRARADIQSAIEVLERVSEEERAQGIGNTEPFQEEINFLLQSEGGIVNVGDYVERMQRGLTECDRILAVVLSNERSLTDGEVIWLFRFFHGISLLNAVTVGLGV